MLSSAIVLELQSAFARGIGESLHAAVEQETATVENHAGDARLPGALGQTAADALRGRNRRAGGAAHVLLERRGRGDGAARPIVDDLGVDVPARAVDRKPRAVAGALAERG